MKRSELIFAAVLAVIAALAVLVVDVLAPPREMSAGSAPPGRFLSSGWYCPSPPTADDLGAFMITGNLGERSLGLRRLSIGAGRQSDPAQASVKTGRSSVVSLADFKLGDAAGLVDTFGGPSATDLVVLAKGKGAARAHCSDQPSNRWLFASASTARGEAHSLLVVNPFKEEAVISVRFIAPDKDLTPARLKDLVVPAQSQISVPLVEYLAQTPSFGLEVTATRGRVVVGDYAQVTNRGGAKGISLDIGEPAPSTEWTFAEGKVPDGGEESIAIVNPGSREALVTIVFMTEGDRVAPPALAELAVPAGRQIVVNVAENLPRGTSHGISISSTNSEPVVAQRLTTAEVDRSNGYENTFGVPATAQRWAVAVGSPAGGSTTMALVNPGQTATQVRITLLGIDRPTRPGELQSIQLGAGRKRSLDLTALLGGAPATAVVESGRGPIAVESTTALPAPYSDVLRSAGHRLP